MTPVPTPADVPYHLVGDVRIVGDVLQPFAGVVTPSNVQHHRRRQFGAVVLFAVATALLLGHVPLILGASPEEKMGRIHALGVVALVEHAQVIGDRAVGQFPRQSMGQDTGGTLADAPVPLWADVADIPPTRFRLFDVPPESLSQRLDAVASAARLADTETARHDNELAAAITADAPIAFPVAAVLQREDGQMVELISRRGFSHAPILPYVQMALAGVGTWLGQKAAK